VVSNRQRIQPQPSRFSDERFRRRDTIEEAEAAVHVEFGVVHVFFVGWLKRHRLIGLSLGGPGG
jgi:hypothetical protein